jgi:uncharacterized protein (TIGR00252 family)
MVIAPSESVRQVMVAFGVRAPIRIIENGIDLEPFLQPPRPRIKADFGFSDSALLLVYVGRLAAEKNLPVLVHQFALARGRLLQLRLAIIGKGPQEDELRLLAGQLGQADAIRFCGSVPFDEVPNWLAAADAFITASTSEVHPLTVIEAMAAGKPILAIRSPGISDIVQSGVCGLLAETTGGLAEVIVSLADDPARTREMGAAAREAARRYDIRRTVAETVALYDELLGRPTWPLVTPDGKVGWHARSADSPVAGGTHGMSEHTAEARRRLGDWGENLAALHLEAQGYTIVARNWRCRIGEIDLVARDGEAFVFVEVKTRRGRAFGAPEEALTPKKAEKLSLLGQQYMVDHALDDVNWRIDLVVVELDGRGRLLRCEHMPGAVWGW